MTGYELPMAMTLMRRVTLPRIRRRELDVSPLLIGSLPGWECATFDACGLGVTPADAYAAWQRQRDAREAQRQAEQRLAREAQRQAEQRRAFWTLPPAPPAWAKAGQ